MPGRRLLPPRARLRGAAGGGPAAVAAAGVPAPRGLRVALAAFSSRNFAIFWTGALLSNIGTWMQAVTVPFVLYDLTGSAAVVGLGAFLQFFPMVVMGPLGGSVADRFPRRHVLLVTQGAMALLAAGLAGLWIGGVRSPAAILMVVAATGAVSGINVPTWQAFVPELVPRHQLLNAVTLNSAQFNGARAVGPALAGVVLATVGPGGAFLLNALSFGAVIVALLLVRVVVVRRPRPTSRVLRQFAEGLAHIRGHAGMVACIALVSAVAFLGMPVLQLMSVFATDVFDVGPGAYGVLTASLGAGGVAAAPVVAGWGRAVRRGRLVGAALAGYGAALVAFALSPTMAVGVLFAGLAGMGFLTVVSSLNTTVQELVDDRYRGRVMATYVMAFTGAYPLGSVAQGWLSDRVGAPATVAGAGALLVLLAVGLLLGGNLLRTLDDAGGPARAEQLTGATSG